MQQIGISPIIRMDRIGFNEYAKEHVVPATLRLLIVSDGSMTRLLRGWSLADVTLETVCLDDRPAGKETAQWLEIPEDTSVYHREVWLKANDDKLVFASSDWHLSNTDIELDNLATQFVGDLRTSAVPVGDLIRRRGLWSRHDLLEIGQYRSDELSRLWGGESFWGRRYRMQVEGIVSGTILEIFSPRLGEAQ
ncbi:MAG: chorismate pyruvate-lyase family protein [Nitrospirota bacterium]|nr:chorismate pyruvate-lyase family protein [Nitrospirota bacterium]